MEDGGKDQSTTGSLSADRLCAKTLIVSLIDIYMYFLQRQIQLEITSLPRRSEFVEFNDADGEQTHISSLGVKHIGICRR